VNNGSSVWIHCTHLIIFNERAAINHNYAQKRTPRVARSPALNIIISQDVLSLPYLHRLSERNLEYIQQFGGEVNTNRTGFASVSPISDSPGRGDMRFN